MTTEEFVIRPQSLGLFERLGLFIRIDIRIANFEYPEKIIG